MIDIRWWKPWVVHWPSTCAAYQAIRSSSTTWLSPSRQHDPPKMYRFSIIFPILRASAGMFSILHQLKPAAFPITTKDSAFGSDSQHSQTLTEVCVLLLWRGRVQATATGKPLLCRCREAGTTLLFRLIKYQIYGPRIGLFLLRTHQPIMSWKSLRRVLGLFVD